MFNLNIGIVGCGLIGQKRAASLGDNILKAVADVSLDRAEKLACCYNDVKAFPDWKELVELDDIDIVIVSTTNNWLAPITLKAVESGKHVLVEKPGACHFEELDPVIEAARKNMVKVKVGFNLRCHPSFLKAHEIINSGVIGKLMFIRGRYGHGGRLGYEKEWRANPAISGGGELIDQGVHLIDLSRWFLGDFTRVSGSVHTYFWDMPVEDNGFLHLETSSGNAAWLQVSCTEWKNMFSFEIYGEHGKLQVDGLGGSYGTERLTFYRMLPEMGPPETTIWEYPANDTSWKIEFEEFIKTIESNSEPHPGLKDARAALDIVSKIYEVSKK